MSDSSLLKFVSKALAEQDVQAVNLFENMPESMNIYLKDNDGNIQILDISAALTLYSGEHAPWFINVDISGALTELEQELGFDIDTLHDQTDQCFRVYIKALSEANDACSHLYVYSRRLDAVHTWGVSMPESLRSSAGEAIQKELRTYLKNLGNGMLLHETLEKYGKAIIKAKRLKSTLNVLNLMTNMVSKNNSEMNMVVSVTSVSVDNETVAGLVNNEIIMMPKCRQCKEQPVNCVVSPCGHVACIICIPVDCGNCPQCGNEITLRQQINLND